MPRDSVIGGGVGMICVYGLAWMMRVGAADSGIIARDDT